MPAQASYKDAAVKADQTKALAHSIVQAWRAEFRDLTVSTSAATALAKPKCLEACQLHVSPCPGGGTPHLFLTLTSKSFNQVRERFGAERHVGSSMPPELPKSWSYLQHTWNKHARTAVSSAIESITDGDENSVIFHLFGDGKKKKSTRK